MWWDRITQITIKNVTSTLIQNNWQLYLMGEVIIVLRSTAVQITAAIPLRAMALVKKSYVG